MMTLHFDNFENVFCRIVKPGQTLPNIGFFVKHCPLFGNISSLKQFGQHFVKAIIKIYEQLEFRAVNLCVHFVDLEEWFKMRTAKIG